MTAPNPAAGERTPRACGSRLSGGLRAATVGICTTNGRQSRENTAIVPRHRRIVRFSRTLGVSTWRTPSGSSLPTTRGNFIVTARR